MIGAGGTNGGIGHFLIGLVMMCGGGYLLLNAIVVRSSFGLGYQVYQLHAWGNPFPVTSGMILVPFMLGIGMIFFNAKNILGWVLACGAITALVFGVIASLNFTFRPMSAFDLLMILVLAIGGLGLFLRSLRSV